MVNLQPKVAVLQYLIFCALKTLKSQKSIKFHFRTIQLRLKETYQYSVLQ